MMMVMIVIVLIVEDKPGSPSIRLDAANPCGDLANCHTCRDDRDNSRDDTVALNDSPDFPHLRRMSRSVFDNMRRNAATFGEISIRVTCGDSRRSKGTLTK